MLELLYGKCALSADPCGTVEYIRTITPELLDRCRKIAYTPDRMVACVCGNVDVDRIIEQTEKALFQSIHCEWKGAETQSTIAVRSIS